MAKIEFNTGIETLTIFLVSVMAAGHWRALFSTTVEARRSLPRNETRRLKGVTQEGESDRSNRTLLLSAFRLNDPARARSLAPHLSCDLGDAIIGCKAAEPSVANRRVGAFHIALSQKHWGFAPFLSARFWKISRQILRFYYVRHPAK
jgi:hypothetical protein